MPSRPLVLIVDDEEIYLTIVTAMVKKLGLPTISARDGLEAVQIFAQYRQMIGCVLMDLQMPHMDGVDACRRIREMDGNIPVIFASGYLESDKRELLKPLNPTGYLKKPVGFHELSQFLTRLLPATPHPVERGGIPDNACAHNPGRGCD